ncbi:unnamed protein product (macronuclear) [Paramecium tetraurelia]|uniref:Transmembrane protein n=1 Tax=Paramecium tetraurelia TaxID=5888 RepID=A0BZZ0_PARTE|nr:uncharacterized protein GSPATT00005959001 [Paramecium tetraurelia]CAK64107.1 unnamed protein product [Paramecium tetraurelia]|eukprot:XP_001431505.1 hypothetical protein (macronuclear) [Paramecium tetraurelia strain d4-2]
MKISRLFFLIKLFSLCCCEIEELTYQNPMITKYIDILSNSYYGIVSFYVPLSLQANFINSLAQSVDRSFLFSAYFNNDVSIVAYCKLNIQANEITHTLILVQQQAIQEQEFSVSFDPLLFEGQLICTSFCYDAEQQNLQFIIQTKNDIQYMNLNKINLEQNNVKFVFGGSNQNLELSSFQGQLYGFWEDTEANIYFYLNYLFGVDSCSYAEEKAEFDSKEYDQDNTWQFTLPFIVYKDYSMYFWHRFATPLDSNDIVSLIHISTQFQLNPQYSLGTNTLMINYELKHNNQILVTVHYYSYQYPYILYDPDYIESLIKVQQIEEIDSYLIYQWHYTIIQYQFNELFIQIFYPDQQRRINFKDETVRQFSYSQFSLIFGDSMNQKQYAGQVNQFKFKNCQEEFIDTYQCHFSCATCNGPLKNSCLSCQENSYRNYDPDNHTCTCQIWTIEQNSTKCFSISDINQMEVSYIEDSNNDKFDQIEPNIVCSYGYFLFEGDCYQCPSASQKGDLICLECLDNWQNWIQNSICSEYVLSKIQYDYDKEEYNYDVDYISINSLYLFIDHELRMCNFCIQFCLHTSVSYMCNFIKEQHLGKDTYVECKFGYDSQTQSCKLPQFDLKNERCLGQSCNGQCKCCSPTNRCKECINDNDVLLLNNKDCVQCSIQNCKLCFQYFQQSDGIFVSTLTYTNYEEIITNEDYLIGCALCEDNYIYNFFLNVCQLKLQISQSCENYLIDQNNQPVCLTTLTQNFDEGIEISDCFKYLKSCQNCVKTNTNKLYCTTCFKGFFQNSYGYCESCDENFRECKLTYQNQYDITIQQLQPLLLAISKGQVLFYPPYYVYEVQIGMCYQSDKWSKKCKEDKIITYCSKYYDNVCIKCNSDDTQTTTLSSGICYLCPYQCKICLPSLLDSTQLKCFLTDFSTHYIDQLSGKVKIKRDNQVRYSNQLTVQDLSWKDQYSDVFKQQVFQRMNFLYVLNNPYGVYQYKRLSQKISESYENHTIQQITVLDNSSKQQLVSLYFIDYQIVNITNLTITISELNKDELIKTTSKYGVDIYINNLIFNQTHYVNFQKYIFLLLNITSLSINNLTLINVDIQNFHLFKLSISNSSTSIKINLINLKLINCEINKLPAFFPIYLIGRQYLIRNKISIMHLYKILTFFIFLGQLVISLLDSANFTSSSLFSNYTATQTRLASLTIMNNQFKNSNFFVADLKFEIYSTKIQNTTIRNSQFIYFIQQLSTAYQKEFLIINQLLLSQLEMDSSLLRLSQNIIRFVQFLNIEVRDLTQFKNDQNYSSNLFLVQADMLIIKNYFSYNFNSNQIQIDILNSNKIELYNIFIQGDNNDFRINHEAEFSDCPLRMQFLNVYNFTSLMIQDFQIQNVMICNNNFINIKDVQNQITLNIDNLKFNDIILLQLQGTAQTTMIAISISKQSMISFTQFAITNVFGNNYERLRKVSEQLTIISVVAAQSTLELLNSYLKSNIITNSTNALIYLELKSISLQNFTNIESNYFTEQIYTHLNQEYTKISISSLQQLFPIKSEGSVFNILCQKLTLNNIANQNSVALLGGFCKIELILDCGLLIQNTYIHNSKSIQAQESKGGSFYINAKDTNLILKMINITISHSFSLYDGGFLFLIPSDRSNLLTLENIKATGVFSMFRGFMSVEFSLQTSQNVVILKNIDIQLEYAQMEYITSNYDELKDNELEYIKITNGYLYFNYCQIQLININLSFEIITQPVFYLSNMQNLHIMNFNLEVGEQTSNTIIEFESIKSSQDKDLFIKSFKARQVKVTIPEAFYAKSCYSSYKYEIIHLPSLSEKSIALKINNCLINQLSKVYQDVESIIQIRLLDTFRNFRFCNGIILNFHTNSFSMALIDIYYQTQVKSKFELLYLLNNKCTRSTCLRIRSNDQYRMLEVILKQIYMLNNDNSKNGQLTLSNLTYLIKQSYFMNNRAMEMAGAIYLQNSPLKIQSSYFINNSAPLVGAIYCSNISIQDRQVLTFSSLFLNNVAKYAINTFGIEFYSLSLSHSVLQNQVIANYSQISAFKDQGSSEQYLVYLPSGQTLKQYQIFNTKVLRYQSLEFSLKFIILNSFQEKQIINNYSIKCNITSSLIDKEYNVLQDNITMFSAEFNTDRSELNLENNTFVLNPYSGDLLKIKISCDNIENNNQYELFAKAYKCQMGEFFYEDQCLKCNASRGYYSVNPLNGECIKANPNSIQNHTENLLNLYEGFWRLNILTPIAEYCSNDPSNCLGGWETGDITCIIGHIGALCEACDIYNVRGQGQFSKSRDYKCSQCTNSGFLIVEFLLAFIWAFSQIVLAVKGTQLQNQKFLLSKSQTKFYDILVRLSQDQSSSVIKLISNYFQIIMVVYTFKVEFISNLDSLFQFIGNSTYSTTYNFDCYISKIEYLDIIYLNLIWILQVQFLQYVLYLLLSFFIKLSRPRFFSLETVYSSFFYLYLSGQINLIKLLAELITPKTISNVEWISANLSYRFWTTTHQKVIFALILPLLIMFGLIIPLFLFLRLSQNKYNLSNYKIKQKYGYLFNEYSKTHYYWESVKLMYRQLLILIIVLLQDFIVIKGIMLIGLLFAYQIIFSLSKPYNVGKLNQFESQAIQICIWSILLCILQYEIQEFNLWLNIICQLLILMSFIILIVKSILKFIQVFSSKYELIIDYIKTKIVRCLNLQNLQNSKLFELSSKRKARVQKYFKIIKIHVFKRVQTTVNIQQTQNVEIMLCSSLSPSQKQITPGRRFL